MRKWFFICLLLMAWMPKSHAQVDLQQLIDRAQPGEVVEVPAGDYKGHFIITKPLTLKGNATMSATGSEAVLSVSQTENVHLEGFTLKTNGTAIEIKNAKNISLQNLHMNNVNAGVKVYNSAYIRIKNIGIVGRTGHYSKKENGISFYKSKDITVEQSDIRRVQDGVYLEETKGITVQKNRIRNGRYGIHFMYSDNATAKSNIIDSNVTACMVMIAKNIHIVENEIVRQHQLNSYGVILYDVKKLQLENNVFSENRTAISMQNSHQVLIQHNQFQMNETALETVLSNDTNIIANNSFTGNILAARSDKNGARLEGNYYDDYVGLDANNDGVGDTPYVALSSFGQWMVREPAYQYFVESPAVSVLSTVDKQTNRSAQNLLSDQSPMMVSEQTKVLLNETKSMHVWQVIIGLLLVLISGFWWKRGIQS